MTLTEAAAATKKGIIVFVITLIVIFTTWAGWHYYYNYIYLPGLPKVVEQPTLVFGLLPQVNFPESVISSGSYTYTLDTETGGLPDDTPRLFKVYSIAQLATDLLALDRAKSLAKSLQFNETPLAISATQYKFIDDIKGGELIVDLDTGNFKFRRNAATGSGENYQNIEDFIDEQSQIQNFRGFLSSKGLLKDQLKNGKGLAVYNNPVKRESTLVTVNLWQDPVDEYPIVTPKFNEGLIKAVSDMNRNNDKRYILLDYIFWPIDLENFGTYPIKTAAEAYEELQNGDGFIAIEPRTSSVSIAKVYLAYYLSEDYSNYLLPVYVFEGQGFAGLVPAVVSDYIDASN